MRCKTAQRFLSARSDGELSNDRREPLDQHLAGCDACRAFTDDLAIGSARLELFVDVDASTTFTQRVMTALPEQRSRFAGLGALLDFLRPAPIGLTAAAFSLGAVLTLVISDEARSVAIDTEPNATTITEESLDSFAVLAELTNEESFADLLTDNEE